MASHVVLDTRHLNTSTGVYMQHLLTELDRLLPEAGLRCTALVPAGEVETWSARLSSIEVVAADQPWYSVAEQTSLARQLTRLRPDLVHFCMPQQPLAYRGARVTTVHDLTLVRFDNLDMNPALYRVRKLIFTGLLRNVLRRSRAIITPTRYVRDDIVAYSRGRYADKITVTHEAGDPLAEAPELVEALADAPYLFFIGNAFPFKNLPRIVSAYRLLKAERPDLHLVFAGRPDDFYAALQRDVEAGGIPDVHFLGFVSEGEKRWLFQHATAYVVASLSEGFHIPGLEAMYEGCPVISSAATCLPEVYADAALYFDPHDTDALATQVRRLLDEPGLRDRMSQLGAQQAASFSWQRMAEQTVAVYLDALRPGRRR